MIEGLRRIALGLVDHPEGVAIDADGTIWCGGEEGQVYVLRLDEEPREVARLDGHLLGLALDGAGAAYCVALGARPGLYRVTREGETALVTEGTPERRARIPNHPLFLPDGTLLLTESGDFGADSGCTFAVPPGGAPETTRIADESCRRFPNGLALHPSGEEVWVVESTLPGVAALRLAADGALSDYRVVCETPGHVPDGIAFDVEGRALVSCWTPDTILLVERDGSVRTLLHDPLRQQLISPANVAFVPGTATVVAANVGNRFLTVFEHDAVGAELPRPALAAA